MSIIATIPDDRITCAKDCVRFARGAERCNVDNARTIPDLLRRCEHFMPLCTSADKRSGSQRWPHLVQLWDEQ